MNEAITRRRICPEDQPFLYQVYASTRTEELAPLGWSQPQLDAFLTMQFIAQHRYYQEQFPEAKFEVILRHGEPIGRLYVDRKPDEIRIIDIALLPAHRNAGIGSALLHELFAEADRDGKPVRIHVEQFNPALHLYRRLGFVAIGDNGVYHHMERRPSRSPLQLSR
jgi:ribosomal protein S18 acetylase RimI-like enzyme